MGSFLDDAGRDGGIDVHLRADHRRLAELLAGLDTARPRERTEHLREFARELVSHEVAEELVVYPVVRRQSAEAARICDARLGEQAEAERHLDKLGRLAPGTVEFEQELAQLRVDVLEHAELEEQSVLPLLAVLAGPDREMLARRYVRARSLAPTHPHPAAPDRPPGNVVIGPVAGLFDRLRDALGSGA